MKKFVISKDMEKIIYDKLAILKDIEKKGKYQDKDSIIKKWEEEDDTSNMFVVQNGGNSLPFLGVVNGMFQREGYAVNNYPNGDNYFGYYSEDERNKHGLYSFNPTKNKEFINSEYYFGLWKDDLRDGHGIYLWLTESSLIQPFTDFDNANFKAYVGIIEQDNFTKGTLLTKENNIYYVYHGTFSKTGKKEGEKCFYYSASLERLLYGTFVNNYFKGGYIANFNDEGNILQILKYSKGKVILNTQIDKNELDEVYPILFNFRNIIMSKDYFGEIYNEFAKVISFKKKYMKGVDILNSDKYIDIMNSTFAYNKISIFKDIEKAVEYK